MATGDESFVEEDFADYELVSEIDCDATICDIQPDCHTSISSPTVLDAFESVLRVMTEANCSPLEMEVVRRCLLRHETDQCSVATTAELNNWRCHVWPHLHDSARPAESCAVVELLCAVSGGCRAVYGACLTPLQLAAVVQLLLKPPQRGRLLALPADEDTGAVVAALSVARCLLDASVVDVVAPTVAEAQRGAAMAMSLCRAFGLSCAALPAAEEAVDAASESDAEAAYAADVTSVRKLVSQADQALYEAKKQNERRWKMFVGMRA